MSWDIDQEEAEECYRERSELRGALFWLINDLADYNKAREYYNRCVEDGLPLEGSKEVIEITKERLDGAITRAKEVLAEVARRPDDDQT